MYTRNFYSCQLLTKFRKKIFEERYYSNGKLKREYEITSDSLFDGHYKVFRPDGKLDWEGNYKHGLRNGLTIDYNPNGTILEKLYYSNGTLDSGKAYNRQGKFVSDIWPVDVVTKADTIKARDTFQAKITLRNVKFSNGVIYIGCRTEKEYNSLKGKREITVNREEDTFRNNCLVKMRMDTPGVYVFDGYIFYNEVNGRENGSDFKHTFVVTP